MTDQQLAHVDQHVRNTKSYADSLASAVDGLTATLESHRHPRRPTRRRGRRGQSSSGNRSNRYSGRSDFADNALNAARQERQLRNLDPFDPLRDNTSENDPSNPNDTCDPMQSRDPAGGGNADGDLPRSGPFLTPPPSPLVFDLDGDGVELTALAASLARFDLNAGGFAERTGWVGGGDGILVLAACRTRG